jgi:phosphate:Na+ symporter
MDLFETIGTMLAGIGMFFSGVKIVGNSLKNMTSHKFRILVSKWTGNSFLGALWGFLSGAISQSSSNTAFILISLVNSGLVKVRNALPIVAWSNVGTTLLIFLVAINMKLAILVMLGLSGVLYGFDKGSRREHVFSTVFGISVLLFGFQLLKSGSQPFADLEFINTIFSFTSGSFIYPILLGAFLRFIIHSSSTVTVLIMTISHAGLIGLEQVVLMIYGMGFGEGLIVYILSSGMKGTSRQLSLFKVYEAYLASAIMLILFAIEFTTHIPLFFDLISYLGSTIEQQTAYSFFAVKIVPVVIMTFFYGSIYKMLVKISPPLHEENLSKLQFINEHSLRDVETALTLVESEQERIIRRFPMYIENIMQDANNKNLTDLNLLHKSTLPLLDELDNFLKNVINMNLSHQTSERFINIQNRQNQIRSIELSLFSFADTIRLTNIQGSVNQLIENLVQALHANISLVADAAKSHDEFDLMMVINATNDRGDLMERIRKQYLSLDSDIQAEDKPLLLYITDLFQRIIWLSNKWATLQKAAISN